MLRPAAKLAAITSAVILAGEKLMCRGFYSVRNPPASLFMRIRGYVLPDGPTARGAATSWRVYPAGQDERYGSSRWSGLLFPTNGRSKDGALDQGVLLEDEAVGHAGDVVGHDTRETFAAHLFEVGLRQLF